MYRGANEIIYFIEFSFPVCVGKEKNQVFAVDRTEVLQVNSMVSIRERPISVVLVVTCKLRSSDSGPEL